MTIELKERTEQHVLTYFDRTQDPDIRCTLPQSARTAAQAVEQFHATLLPGATSYGRTVYVDGEYVGDIWCYCIDPTDTPQTMVSYCLFEKALWSKGIMTRALQLFLDDILPRFSLRSVGAFTYADHIASIRVLEKVGFAVQEEFTEDGVKSVYLQLDVT